jgi:hypothetical protein
VLAKGMPTAASYPLDPTGFVGTTISSIPGAIKSSPVLIAARECGHGRGRVVLWPMWTSYGIGYGSSPCVGGMLMSGERDGKPSDGKQLIKNLLRWLAEPSQGSKSVGVFDPDTFKVPERATVNADAQLAAWAKPRMMEYHRKFKGLIGVHSSLSDGKASPKEMIEAARKAGYDFMAFSENLPQMDEQKWKQLLAVCDKANERNPDLIAYPGIKFQDEAGNHGISYTQRWWIRDEWRSKKYPDRLEYLYGLTYQIEPDPNRWQPRVIMLSKQNNKRPWQQALWHFFAPYCYERGKLVDDSIGE